MVVVSQKKWIMITSEKQTFHGGQKNVSRRPQAIMWKAHDAAVFRPLVKSPPPRESRALARTRELSFSSCAIFSLVINQKVSQRQHRKSLAWHLACMMNASIAKSCTEQVWVLFLIFLITSNILGFCQALQIEWKIHCRRAPCMILTFLLAMTNLFLQVRKGNYRRAGAYHQSLRLWSIWYRYSLDRMLVHFWVTSQPTVVSELIIYTPR